MTRTTAEEPQPSPESSQSPYTRPDDLDLIHRTMEFAVEPASLPECKTILAAFLRHIRKTEPGTVLYNSFQDLRDPTHFLNVMAFADRKALEAHVGSLAYRLFICDLGTMLRRPVIVTDLSLFDTC